MNTLRAIIIIMLGILQISCGNQANRAEFDKGIGKIETNSYKFSAYQGMLHIIQNEQNSLQLKATSPVFGARVTNKSNNSLELAISISNINEDLELTGPDLTSIPVAEQISQLTKKWAFVIPAGESLDFNSSTPLTEPFDFLAMGDIQEGIETFDKVIEVLNQQEDIDFILFLGDVTINSQAEQFEAVVAAFEQIKFPIYSTPGNHDIKSSEPLYQHYFGRANYSFKYKDVVFTGVDSGSWSMSAQTWDWYRDWLEDAKSDTHIVFSHISPTESFGLRGGQWKSRREANSFIAHASRKDVDAMFYGHLHTLDILTLAGIPTYITGGAGAPQEQLDGIERHFLKVSVIPDTKEIKVMTIKVD